MAIYARDAGVWKNVTGGESTLGNANFTNTATGTYTYNGVDYKYLTITGTQSVTFDVAGLADVFVLGAGGAGAGGNTSG